MTKIKVLLILTILTALLMLGGCGTYEAEAPPHEPLTLQDVLAIAQERREGIEKPTVDFIPHLLQERGGDVIRRERFVSPGRVPASRPAQRLIDDFEMFTNLIIRTYAAYEYFGGDEVFLPVFANIVETLESQEYWDVEDFVTLVSDSLDEIVNDNHFFFGGGIVGGNWEQFQAFGNEYDFFVPADFDDVFDKTENGFRNRRTGAYVRELHFNGEPLFFETEDIFRLKMCSEGLFYYSIVIIYPRSEADTFPVTITYDNGHVDNIAVSLAPFYFIEYEAVSLQHMNGIPVITIRVMGNIYDPVFGACANNFLGLVEEVRDEPVIIVDVRSNRGGQLFLPMMWLYNLLGEVVPTNFTSITHLNTPMELLTIFGERSHDGFTCMFMASERIGDYHVLSYTMPRRIVSNDQLIILLVDGASASAAEAFTDMTLNLENALIIGQNTWGVLLTDGRLNPFFLPNSGALFGFGTALHVFPEGHFSEGIGIAPDIWVNGDALEATLAMLNASSFSE